jgi:hypothetical protein
MLSLQASAFKTVAGLLYRFIMIVNLSSAHEKVKQLLHEGNVTRIIVKNEKGNVMPEIPVTVGVIGVLLAPWLAALGAIAALATNCTIVVERRKQIYSVLASNKTRPRAIKTMHRKPKSPANAARAGTLDAV